MDFWFFYAHDTGATRGQYVALGKADNLVDDINRDTIVKQNAQ